MVSRAGRTPRVSSVHAATAPPARRLRRLELLALAALSGSVGLVGLGAAASASHTPLHATDGLVQTLTFGGPSATAVPLQVEDFVPGDTVVQRYELRRAGGFRGGDFSVGAEALEDLESDCVRPEVNSGDVTCGDGDDQGELSQQLLLGHSWSPATAGCATAPAPVTGTPLAALEGALVLAPGLASVPDEVCLVLSFQLPWSADNLVQSDVSRFRLRVGLANSTPTVPTVPRIDVPLDPPDGPVDPLPPGIPPTTPPTDPSPPGAPSPVPPGEPGPLPPGQPVPPVDGEQPGRAPADPGPPGADGGTAVLPEVVDRPPVDGAGAAGAAAPRATVVSPSALPFTGVELRWMLLAAALLTVAGAAVLRLGRRPVARTSSPGSGGPSHRRG